MSAPETLDGQREQNKSIAVCLVRHVSHKFQTPFDI